MWIVDGTLTNTLFPSVPEKSAEKPYPKALWRVENGQITTDIFPEIPEKSAGKTYPKALWRINPLYNGGMPYHELLPDVDDLGAFANATKLKKVYIPKTVKKIGEFAFRNTKLKSVTIAKDCEYYSTSFPDNCVVKFYDD